jgi:transposase
MEIIYTHCAGLDIHKKTVVACRLHPDPTGKLVRETRTFATFTADWLEMSDWLASVGVRQVAMESTGEYWKPVYNLLEGQFELLVINAQHIKAVPGRKTDVKDAEWIADLLRHGLLKASFIPEAAQRDLRDLTRLRTTVMGERARTLNRLQKLLESANIKLASVVSDVSGVSAQAMLRQLAAGNNDATALAQLAKGQRRDKLPELERALNGVVRPVHRFLLSGALATLDH